MEAKIIRLLKLISMVIFLLAALSSLTLAQEQITITTYYPSPYGSYRDLEAQRIAVAYPPGSATFWDNFATVRTRYGDTIAIGGDKAGNDSEIRIWAPSSRNTVTFWNAQLGTLANIQASNLPGCYRVWFNGNTGYQTCSAGYQATVIPATVSSSSGYFLCCQYQ